MISKLSFNIAFNKFEHNLSKIDLKAGLHVVYGEGGVGKSSLMRALIHNYKDNTSNFILSNIKIPKKRQIISQNPFNNIIGQTIKKDLAFGLECNSNDIEYINRKINKLKNQLPFVDDWELHPLNLSIGEMQALNLVTSFSSKPDCIIIDNGLFYLCSALKKEWADWMQSKISSNMIVLWLTSNYSDLKHGDTKWHLNLDSFQLVKINDYKILYEKNFKEGRLFLDIREIDFSYKNTIKSKNVFNNLSFTIDKVRCFGIVGSNGSGKTTLSQLIAKIIDPDSGKISININPSIPKIAILDQLPENMYSGLSVYQLLTKLINEKKINKTKIEKINKALLSFQINWDLLKNVPIHKVSSSILRITLIIILCHSDYDLIILDEPTYGFGNKQKLELNQFLKKTMLKKHIIIISHDIDFINNHCDAILDLDKNNILYNKHILINA